LWQSADSGATWSRVDTATAPWQSVTGTSVDQAAWLDHVAVVAGSVDGQLAVWVSASAG
jgi:hypothetical protein